jgi:hypothetical protein
MKHLAIDSYLIFVVVPFATVLAVSMGRSVFASGFGAMPIAYVSGFVAFSVAFKALLLLRRMWR